MVFLYCCSSPVSAAMWRRVISANSSTQIKACLYLRGTKVIVSRNKRGKTWCYSWKYIFFKTSHTAQWLLYKSKGSPSKNLIFPFVLWYAYSYCFPWLAVGRSLLWFWRGFSFSNVCLALVTYFKNTKGKLQETTMPTNTTLPSKPYKNMSWSHK